MVQLLVTTQCEVNLVHRWLMFRQGRTRFFRSEQVKELYGQVGGWHMSTGGGKTVD